MPVIPATQEVEIGGLRFKARPGKKLVRSPSQRKKNKKQKTKLGMVVCIL
jgi:hypothetical protein